MARAAGWASPAPRRCPDGPEPNEPGLVVGHILDAGTQHNAAIALCCQAVTERGPRPVVVGDHAHGLGGRGALKHAGTGKASTDEARALGGRLGVGYDRLDLLEFELAAGDQAVTDRMHDLPDDRDVLGLERERI